MTCCRFKSASRTLPIQGRTCARMMLSHFFKVLADQPARFASRVASAASAKVGAGAARRSRSRSANGSAPFSTPTAGPTLPTDYEFLLDYAIRRSRRRSA